MDVKKIGKIPDRGGWRAHGRLATKAEKMRRPKIGYDYVHSQVHDRSRLAYSEIFSDDTGTTCAAFLLRGVAYFTATGSRVLSGWSPTTPWPTASPPPSSMRLPSSALSRSS